MVSRAMNTQIGNLVGQQSAIIDGRPPVACDGGAKYFLQTEYFDFVYSSKPSKPSTK